MKLIYVGKRWVEGWPASDHDEPDRKLADAKLASGLYKRAAVVKDKED